MGRVSIGGSDEPFLQRCAPNYQRSDQPRCGSHLPPVYPLRLVPAMNPCSHGNSEPRPCLSHACSFSAFLPGIACSECSISYEKNQSYIMSLSLLSIARSISAFNWGGRPGISTFRKPRTMVEVASSSLRPLDMR